MTETLVRPQGATQPTRRLTWPAVLALHLLPAAATFAAATALGPVVRALSLPPQFALTLAFAFVLVPIELGLLYHAAGGRSWAALPSVLSFKRKLPPRLYCVLLPSLAALALGGSMLLSPIQRAIDSVYPQSWLLPSEAAASPAATILLVTLVVNGLLHPAVEELYFRAYLLPRLPVGGLPAVLTSATLSATQHYWQPGRFVFMLAAELVLTAVMLRLGSVRISIAARCLLGSLPILFALIAALLTA